MKRDVLNSPRLREIGKKRARGMRNKFFIGLVAFLALFLLFALASRAENINIVKVAISGNKTISPGMVEESAWKELSGNYLWVFPKTNFFFYPKSKIAKRIESDFRLLKDVEVSLLEGGILSISFTERTPAHTWCGENLPPSDVSFEDRKCYFLDESGFIFDVAPFFSGDVYFRFFGKVREEGEDPIGAAYFPEIWTNLISLRETMTEMGLKPSSILIKTDGDVEVYLDSRALPPDSQKILLKKDSNFSVVMENLSSALDTEPLKTDFKKRYSELEYLDLRFGNKVFFKFKE